MAGVKFEITSYSGGQEVLKEAGKMGRFVFGLTEYPGLGADADAYRALLTAAPEMREALTLARTALLSSKPVMAHYEEPCARHKAAFDAVEAALSKVGG